MAEKDDLFQKKDGSGPQDPEAQKPSSDEDDEIIDLLDSVDTPDDAEDVIELSEADMVAGNDADIVELTETIPLEDDDVLELTEEVETSGDSTQGMDLLATTDDYQPDAEADVLELSDVIKTLPPDDAALENSREAGEPDDGVIDLMDAVDEDQPDSEDGILDLTEVAETVPSENDDVLELTDETEDPSTADYEETIALGEEAPIDLTREVAPAEDDDIVELTEAVAEAETEAPDDASPPAEYADTIELDHDAVSDLTREAQTTAPEVPQDEFVELTDAVEDTEPEPEVELPGMPDFEDTIALDQTEVPQDEFVELTDTVKDTEPAPEVEAPGMPDFEDTIALDQTEIPLDDIGEPVESKTDVPTDDQALEPSEMGASTSETEPATLPPKTYEEDKELLELIDDIQATLDLEPQKADAGGEEPDTEVEAVMDDMDSQQEEPEPYELMDDDALFADPELPDSETELYDNLGIDLTSEIERKAFQEMQEAAIEEVQPPERTEAPPETESVETDELEPDAVEPDAVQNAVKQALSDMLSEEDNPLARAIEKAVKKALGQ